MPPLDALYVRTAMAACAQTKITCFFSFFIDPVQPGQVCLGRQPSVPESAQRWGHGYRPDYLYPILARGRFSRRDTWVQMPTVVGKECFSGPGCRGLPRVVIKRGSSASASRGAFLSLAGVFF